MDGSTPPPSLKLETAGYQTTLELPRARRATDNQRRRRKLLGVLGAVVLSAAAGYGVYWFLVGRFYETTNDAYLSADNVTIAPKVSGYIISLDVQDNQAVRKGDVLAHIDPRDYQTAVDSAAADLDNAKATAANIDAVLKEQQSTIAQAHAAVDADRASITFSQQEQQRYADLARSGAGSAQRNQQAQSDLAQKTAMLARDEAALQAAEAHVGVLQTQRQQADATIAAKGATLAQAKLNLDQTTLVAPDDGVIGDRTVRQGQFVQAGAKLMSVVPTNRVYLVANFKETQTGRMVPGQKVVVSLDTFPGHDIAGSVDSLAPGTGAQFALLPPENATGNFTKIVQRVPVKILLDSRDPLVKRLRPGLSATATVDIRPPSSPALAQARR